MWEEYYSVLSIAASDHTYDNAYNIFMEELHKKEETF
jgi:hypothetical protein